MEFLTADWLGTPAWFWLAFIGLVGLLTAFDLGLLHKEDREMGVGGRSSSPLSTSLSRWPSAPGSGPRKAPTSA
jgi:hypothetical protein